MRKIIALLTFVLFLIFAGMVFLGGYLVYESNVHAENSPQEPPETEIKVNVKKDSVSFELKKAAPGLIIFCFGGIGLILLANKIPAHLIIKTTTHGMNKESADLLSHIKSDDIYNLPIPVYWLLKLGGYAEKDTS